MGGGTAGRAGPSPRVAETAALPRSASSALDSGIQWFSLPFISVTWSASPLPQKGFFLVRALYARTKKDSKVRKVTGSEAVDDLVGSFVASSGVGAHEPHGLRVQRHCTQRAPITGDWI